MFNNMTNSKKPIIEKPLPTIPPLPKKPIEVEPKLPGRWLPIKMPKEKPIKDEPPSLEPPNEALKDELKAIIKIASIIF